nr:sigma factor [Stenotrophomonas maltophilia]
MSTPVEPTDVAQLCAAHYRPLHAHVRRKLPQRSDADDVVQETGCVSSKSPPAAC